MNTGLLDGRPMIRDIQRAVAAEFGITTEDMLSDTKARTLLRPRQIAIFLALELSGRRKAIIADVFRRDWNGVTDAGKRIAKLIETDTELLSQVDKLRAQLNAGAAA